MDIPASISQLEMPDQEDSHRNRSSRLALLLVAIMCFAGGYLFAELLDSPHNNADFQIFWQSWDVLEREYYGELPDDTQLIHGAIQGLYTAVGDPYTRFVAPQAAERDRQLISGEYKGLGITIMQDDDGAIAITRVFDDSPAAEADLREGDRLLAIDGTSLEGKTSDEALELLQGDMAAPVQLTIRRATGDDPFTVELYRRKIELPTVYTQTYGDIGYVQLLSFNQKATAALTDAISGLLDQDVSALILDLRNNPGGLLDQAVSVSDLFLDEGVVVRQCNGDGQDEVYHSADGDIGEDIPMAVLINQGSASASEVVAGALQDRERAVLIGENSFGKGSVQHVYDLPDHSQLHVTASLWFTPNETPIQGQGLTPDLVVSASDGADDAFVEDALEYIRGQDG